jgi:hypothetical protein
MKKLIVVLTLLFTFAGQASATHCGAPGDPHCADNPLLPHFSAKEVNWAVQIDGMYPSFQTDPTLDQVQIKESGPEEHTLKFDVSKPSKIKDAYLFIFTEGYNCIALGPPICQPWTVKLNGDRLADEEHTNSQGPNPRGDGKDISGGRQTIRFKINDLSLIEDGENKVFIRADEFPPGESAYYIDGVVLVTFYESQGSHEYWLYDGVEYLEIKVRDDDLFYEEDLTGSTYPDGAEGSLYVLTGVDDPTGDGFEEDDALYLNDNLLEPEPSNYLLNSDESSRFDFVKFDVTDFLDGNDNIKFTFGESSIYTTGLQHNVPIYPSFFLLEVSLSDSAPPEVTFESPTNNSEVLSNETIEITFTVDDSEASVDLLINGSSVSPSESNSGEWNYNWELIGAEVGMNNITAYATDETGNTGSDTIFINVTKGAPTINITQPENGSTLSQDNIIRIRVSRDDPSSNISIRIDGEEVSDKTTYLWDPSSVTVGLHTISAVATDELNQTGMDEITINITSEEVTTTTTTSSTSTTVTGDTTSSTTTTTTTTSTTTTTAPPVTAPPVTEPPVRKVELAINSLTLSSGSSTVKQGEELTAFVLASNAGNGDVLATIVLYSDDEILKIEETIIQAFDSREIEIPIKESDLVTGEHTLKAKIQVQGEGVEEKDPSDNERTVQISVEEETSLTDSFRPFLKWLAIIVVILVVVKLILSFIYKEEDYLR